MSDATYRIDVSLNPHTDYLPWDARIYRLSDDTLVQIVHGVSSDLARDAAQRFVKAETARADGFSVYVDDQGEPVDQQSVKA